MRNNNVLIIGTLAICISIVVLSIITSLVYTAFYQIVIIVSLSSLLLVLSISDSYKKGHLFDPITIFNIFYLFIFILRPISIIFGSVISDDNHVFMIYRNLYGVNYFTINQHLLALGVGLIGQISTYTGYYFYFKNKKVKEKIKGNSSISRMSITDKRVNTYFLYFTLILILVFMFTYGRNDIFGFLTMQNKPDFGTINIIWVQIGTVAVFISVYLHNKVKSFTLLVIFVMLITMSAIGQRAYAVNLLLGVIVILYYQNYKKISPQLFLYMSLIFFIVLLFGNLRSSNIGRSVNDVVIRQVLDEFSMYDMLLVTVNHNDSFGGFNYFGYNYLAIFNSFFPRSIWPFWVSQFDHQHTANIFKGLYGGAVPTSIFGSLYLNFSFIGLVLVSSFFGYFLKKVRSMFSKKALNTNRIILYAMIITLIYDIVRVGDFGREIWTYMVYLGVYYIMILTHKLFNSIRTYE